MAWNNGLYPHLTNLSVRRDLAFLAFFGYIVTFLKRTLKLLVLIKILNAHHWIYCKYSKERTYLMHVKIEQIYKIPAGYHYPILLIFKLHSQYMY
jgi:hypothetical protein